MSMFERRQALQWLALTWPLTSCASSTSGLSGTGDDAPIDEREGEWTDAARGRRVVPWRLYAPRQGRPAEEPLAWVVFSHGLGGSRLAGEYWGRFWAAHGMASLHLQHAGSDRGALLQGGLKGLQAAMAAEQLIARVQDARFALDEVARRARAGEVPWQRLSAERIGIAGHSFGAVTTQALAGQRYLPAERVGPLLEPRFRAAIAFSPSARGNDPAHAFGAIRLPFFSITGTQDITPLLRDVSPENRRQPFEQMPPGDKFLLVFDGASHAAFAGSTEGRRLDDHPAATERVRPLVQRATLWFWQAYLLNDAAAKQRLQALAGELPLGPNDHARFK